MLGLFDDLEEFFKEVLLDMVKSNLSDMFTSINDSVISVSGELSQTPSSWNTAVFDFVKNINDNVAVPIAGLILTAIMCLELINVVMQKNNMQEFDTFEIFKYVIKMWIAVYFVTHAFEIALAAFDVAQSLIEKTANITNISATVNDDQIATMMDELSDKNIGELIGVVIETSLIKLSIQIISIMITIIAYGRMLEIYIYCSVSSIPLSTMGNKEWSDIGKNYLKSLFALGLQGLLLVICLGIYAILISTVNITNIHESMFILLGYTILLAFMMTRSGSIAKNILHII